jgi:3-hydroxyisobutyrate dehydrogenase-like beta-hydroxyacid dehydrogenase
MTSTLEEEMMQRIGILHPGDMGISIAASAQNAGYAVFWASEGRSAATRRRAGQHGLRDAGSVTELCNACTVILSVCPPHAAEDVAQAVIAAGFRGVYLDANAISPQRALRLAQMMSGCGVDFVDGGVIGGPAWKPASTWLYLSGPRAGDVAALFASGPLATHVLGDAIGAASALKMCFAAYSKGTTALLCAVLASADRLGVRAALDAQWARDNVAFPEQAARRIEGATAKAWRFAGEMDEIAATLRSVGLPGEFHDAAAEVYRRLAGFKDAAPAPLLDDVLAVLATPDVPDSSPGSR